MNQTRAKVGIAVITCNRPDLFRQNIFSIPPADTLIVINDGKEYGSEFYSSGIKEIIQHKKNKGVAVSKNEALKYMMDDGCEHIFLCEDDVKIVRNDVCDAYIKAGETSGIYHLNFAYHGPANRDENGYPNEKIRINFQNDVTLSFHSHLTGAFSYYHRSVLEKVGYIDERFFNAYDHLDHTIQIIKAGLHSPFGWFADISDSNLFIEDLDPDLLKSIIRKNRLNFRLRYKLYSYLFRYKNGFTAENYPRASEAEFNDYLKQSTKYRISLGV